MVMISHVVGGSFTYADIYPIQQRLLEKVVSGRRGEPAGPWREAQHISQRRAIQE